MNIQYRLDTSGNLLISPDTATTSSKHVALTLIACAAMTGCATEGVEDSPIKDVAYDPVTHVLSWTEEGQVGTQTVVIDNPSLIGLLGAIFQDHQTAASTETIAQAVVEALPTAHDIAQEVAEQIGLTTALDGASVSVISAVTNSIVPRLKTIDAKADALVELGTKRRPGSAAPVYLKGGK